MGEITQANEDMLYRLFGIDAELLIDHAWGRETTTMKDIKLYKPKSNSMSSGQILPRDYSFEECEVVVKEMTDTLCLDLAEKGVVTNSITLVIGYSRELEMKSAMGTASMTGTTNCYHIIIPYITDVYRRIIDKTKPIRRINISCNHLIEEAYEQYDLFTDPIELEKERKIQKATIEIKQKYGRNALLRGMDLQSAATAIERNRQIGGHKSGD